MDDVAEAVPVGGQGVGQAGRDAEETGAGSDSLRRFAGDNPGRRAGSRESALGQSHEQTQPLIQRDHSSNDHSEPTTDQRWLSRNKVS